MSDRRRFHLDLTGGLLLCTGLIVALSVFSYDAADMPNARIYPANARPANLLGPPGAWLANALIDALGIEVYPLLATWFVLVVTLLVRRGTVKWSLRLLGWLILLPCAAVLADSLGTEIGDIMPNGGGSLGGWLNAWLDMHVVAGKFVVVGIAAKLGIGLAFDFLLCAVLGALWRTIRWSPMFAWRAGRRLLEWTPPLPRLPRLPARSAESIAPPIDPVPEKVEAPPTSPSAAALIPIHHARVETTPQAERAAEAEQFADYELPPLSLLQDPQPVPHQQQEQVLRDRAALLEKTFADFSLKVRVVGIHTGPVITQYEVALETGLRVNKVTVLADDLALNLGVTNVRIVAPIPGKNTVGIELPNEHRAVVRLKEVMLASGFKPGGRTGFAAKAKVPLFLGKDTEGRPMVYDLAEMPHLLIAGRTGTGKSVCMNTLILSMLMTRRPDEVKMIMIDPKRLEMSEYGKVPHLMHPVVTDMKKAEAILSWAVDKMEERYDLLSRARVRGIASYNELAHDEILRRVKPEDDEERQRIPERMPYIVIFIDELADLMMQMKKEVESHIIRLAQKSRAAGIHLVVATQKPTVDVITGLIKSNLPARICFQVASRVDSAVVIDEKGADKLLGKGDMLFLQPGTSTLVRAQGCFASDQEIQSVIENLECDQPCFAQELMEIHTAGADGKGGFLESLRARDPLYEQAIELVVRERRGSVSLLQRALGIGYGRGARLVDYMGEDGIVGPHNGSNAREVLYTPEQWDQVKNAGKLAESA
ncbi:MAG: DNA translocase FtsK 4TM domain-containing protein [Gemmataceae bacterium]|nr:DNA translocase FtsK 4TM domain-containing protein [Gemmataceae bacterium]